MHNLCVLAHLKLALEVRRTEYTNYRWCCPTLVNLGSVNKCIERNQISTSVTLKLDQSFTRQCSACVCYRWSHVTTPGSLIFVTLIKYGVQVAAINCTVLIKAIL